jgi:hypothetical protein
MHLNDFSIARMAELADALASGASVREDVQVQVLFRAQNSERSLVERSLF